MAGCRQELGPEHFPTALVAGRVARGGRPLEGGWLEFLPVDGAVGRLRTAPIGPDGTFRVDGVAVGINGVRVVAPRPAGPESRMLAQGYYIRREIPPGGVTGLEIDLGAEALELRAQAPP